MQKICIWPDYTWCYLEELEQMQFKSDDFITTEIDFEDEPTEEQLKDIIDNQTNTTLTTITTVNQDGTIYPSFDIGNKFSMTSGYLKYFHKLICKQVKITIEILD